MCGHLLTLIKRFKGRFIKKNICFLASCFHLIASKLHFNALSSRIVRGMKISIFEIHQPKPIMGSVHAPKPAHLWKEGGLRNPQRWVNWEHSLALKCLCFRYSSGHCSLCSFSLPKMELTALNLSGRLQATLLSFFGLYWVSPVKPTRMESPAPLSLKLKEDMSQTRKGW